MVRCHTNTAWKLEWHPPYPRPALEMLHNQCTDTKGPDAKPFLAKQCWWRPSRNTLSVLGNINTTCYPWSRILTTVCHCCDIVMSSLWHQHIISVTSMCCCCDIGILSVPLTKDAVAVVCIEQRRLTIILQKSLTIQAFCDSRFPCRWSWYQCK